MPLLAKFTATSNISNSVDCAVSFDKCQYCGRKGRVDRDAKATISCEVVSEDLEDFVFKVHAVLNDGCSSILLNRFVSNNEHWDFRVVLALIPDLASSELIRQYQDKRTYLLRDEIVWIQSLDLRCAVDLPSLILVKICKVVLYDNTRGRKSCHQNEEPRFVRLSVDTDRADEVLCQSLLTSAVFVVYVDFILDLGRRT